MSSYVVVSVAAKIPEMLTGATVSQDTPLQFLVDLVFKNVSRSLVDNWDVRGVVRFLNEYFYVEGGMCPGRKVTIDPSCSSLRFWMLENQKWSCLGDSLVSTNIGVWILYTPNHGSLARLNGEEGAHKQLVSEMFWLRAPLQAMSVRDESFSRRKRSTSLLWNFAYPMD